MGKRNRYVECKLVTKKTRVAPEVKMTIPWLELLAAFSAVMLAKRVIDIYWSCCRGVQHIQLVCGYVSKMKVNSDMGMVLVLAKGRMKLC
jgi:hypothetical protein